MMIFYLSVDVEYPNQDIMGRTRTFVQLLLHGSKTGREVNWFTQGHKEATLNNSVSTSWD